MHSPNCIGGYAMKLIVVWLIVFSLFETVGNATGFKEKVPGSTGPMFLQESEDAKIVRIVTDPVLWSKDFPSLLRTLKSWNSSGEIKVAVLSNEAFGERKFPELSSEILGETGELHSAMKVMPKLKPGVEATLNSTWNQPPDTVTVVGQP